ncbi:metallophosphoesterase [Cellulomonas sp. P22]|uniref:metallophosphoesterase family protein n=1 Tax=Cellulomonas sp. P22 TaxID=3373189 RepID=UPI00378DD591
MSEPSAASERLPDPTDRIPGARRPSRWWRVGLPVVVAVLIAVVFGVTTASAQLSLGPHEARYDVTTDSTVTLDLGPLGTLQIDSPLPLTLGVHATVQEIPESFTAVDAATTLQALSGDLQGYLQFFAGPEATVHDVTRALVTDAAGRTAGALVVLLGAWFGLGWLLGAARREELAARVAPHRFQVVAGSLAVCLALGVLTSSLGAADRPRQAARASAVFDGTALEGARVTGRLGGVIDTYGGYVLDAYRSNTAFYDAASASLDVAWTEAQEPAPTVAPTPSGTPSPTPSPSEEPAEPVVLLVVSDLHCNVGMATVIGRLAEISGAQVILDAGDTAMNGTSVEQYCVTTFAQAAPAGVPIVTSPGNHDSRETSAMYAKAGATVLSGDVVEVAGLRILGDSDPNETRLGAGTSSADTETVTEAGRRLADVACRDEAGVDLLLVHTPRVGQAALDEGCVPAQVSGHLHRRVGPLAVGQGVRYGSSSTAGASLGQATVGPLNGTAELTVLRFDPDRRRFLDYQVVRVATDASVAVEPRTAWPEPVRSPFFTPAPKFATSGPMFATTSAG